MDVSLFSTSHDDEMLALTSEGLLDLLESHSSTLSLMVSRSFILGELFPQNPLKLRRTV